MQIYVNTKQHKVITVKKMSPLLGIISPTVSERPESRTDLARNFLYPRVSSLLSEFPGGNWQRDTVGSFWMKVVAAQLLFDEEEKRRKEVKQ